MIIQRVDDVYVKVHCDGDVAQELNSYFTFNVPNAKFSPAFRNKVWDGKIRLFSTATHYIYGGLTSHIEQFAKERDYEINYADRTFADTNFSIEEALEFIRSVGLPADRQPRDYQLEAFVHAIRKRRALLLSPTASGKSLIIYLISRYLLSDVDKILIVVPTTSLVHQMASDFVSYGCPEDLIHKIYSGQEKVIDTRIVITTWQSVYKLSKTWYQQFHTVIGDEAHLFKANSLKTMMTKMITCPYRFGFTGTLDGSQTHQLVLEGLFGAVRQVTSTKELMDQKHVTELKIKAIVLSYSDELRKLYKGVDYTTEIDFIKSHNSRNKFIVNLVLSLKSNTLVLFKHKDLGKLLYDWIWSKCQDRRVFYVDGDIDGLVREDIRHAVENEQDAIIVASLGTFSTGVNIRNLHNIIFTSPSKSRIKTLQSIGRSLRLSTNKDFATLFDIADDLSWKSKKNYTILHFMERVSMYDDEKFDYKIYNVNLGD